MTREEKLEESLQWFLDTFEPEKAYMREEFEKAKKVIKENKVVNNNPYHIDYKRQTQLEL